MSYGYTGLVVGISYRVGFFNKVHIYLAETYETYDEIQVRWYKAKVIKCKSRFQSLLLRARIKKERLYTQRMYIG